MSSIEDRSGESFVSRMIEILRKSPVLRLSGNKTVTFKNIRPPAKSLTPLSRCVIVNGEAEPVDFGSAGEWCGNEENLGSRQHEKHT